MESLKRDIDNRVLIGKRHSLHDRMTQHMGSTDQAQEEDKKPGMSSQQRAPDSQALDMDNHPLDPGRGDNRDTVTVRPMTVNDKQK